MSVYLNIIIQPFLLFAESQRFFEACPCNILLFCFLMWDECNYFFWKCLCCWVETEGNTVGGATTCTHAQYFLDVSLIHATLWRPGPLLFSWSSFIFCLICEWSVMSIQAWHYIRSQESRFFHWPIPARSTGGAMVYTPSQKSVGARGCVWLCWLRPEGFWIGGTVFLPITVAWMSKIPTTTAELNVKILHTSFSSCSALIHSVCFLCFFLSYYLTILLWNDSLKQLISHFDHNMKWVNFSCIYMGGDMNRMDLSISDIMVSASIWWIT